MISGERWTLAWSTTKEKNEATGERPKEWMLISDNFHLSAPCRSPLLKETFAKLRSRWSGVQIYLKGGVRLISPLYDPLFAVPESIDVAIRDSERHIKYIKDVPPPRPTDEANAEEGAPAISPDGPVPVASVAHTSLKYGAMLTKTSMISFEPQKQRRNWNIVLAQNLESIGMLARWPNILGTWKDLPR